MVFASISVSVTILGGSGSGETRSASLRRPASITVFRGGIVSDGAIRADDLLIALAAGLGAQHVTNAEHGQILDHCVPFLKARLPPILPDVPVLALARRFGIRGPPR